VFGTVLGRVWGSACVLISRQFGAGLGELVCADVGKYAAGLGEWVCAVFGPVCGGFRVVSVCCVWTVCGGFGGVD